jgi:F-type H+-transporting ATPase subunit b
MHALIHSGIRLLAAEGEHHDITQTPSKFWPESYEIIYGGISSILIFSLLFWKVGPLVKKAMAARTAKIQAEIDTATNDRTSAMAEAEQIRAAKGDIAAERARLLAEADAQAAAVREDGATRLAAEVADLEARAESDIAASAGRVGAELRAEIARLSSAAVDHVVTGALDDATQQELIENFITRVGASA